MSCPSDSAIIKPCSGAHPSPLHQPRNEPALELSGNCSFTLRPETYHVKGCEDAFPVEHSAFPSVPAAGSDLSFMVLYRAAAYGQICLSAVLPAYRELTPSQEPSSAQQQRMSPRHIFLCPLWASSRCPQSSKRTCCETGRRNPSSSLSQLGRGTSLQLHYFSYQKKRWS